MKLFVINLDHATERMENLRREATELGFEVHRVPAVFGDQIDLPCADYSESSYRRMHGKQTNRREIGCYLSHVRALSAFLDSSDEHGVIVEDDAQLHPQTQSIVQEAITLNQPWDMLRLSGLHSGTPVRVGQLSDGFSVAVNLSRQTGAGAYVVNRQAAKQLVDRLTPMKLPYDHAFDREWLYGFRSLSLVPYPVTQNARYATSIQHSPKYGPSRYLTVFPYRAANESTRFVHRTLQLAASKIRRQKAA